MCPRIHRSARADSSFPGAAYSVLWLPDEQRGHCVKITMFLAHKALAYLTRFHRSNKYFIPHVVGTKYPSKTKWGWCTKRNTSVYLGLFWYSHLLANRDVCHSNGHPSMNKFVNIDQYMYLFTGINMMLTNKHIYFSCFNTWPAVLLIRQKIQIN